MFRNEHQHRCLLIEKYSQPLIVQAWVLIEIWIWIVVWVGAAVLHCTISQNPDKLAGERLGEEAKGGMTWRQGRRLVCWCAPGPVRLFAHCAAPSPGQHVEMQMQAGGGFVAHSTVNTPPDWLGYPHMASGGPQQTRTFLLLLLPLFS